MDVHRVPVGIEDLVEGVGAGLRQLRLGNPVAAEVFRGIAAGATIDLAETRLELAAQRRRQSLLQVGALRQDGFLQPRLGNGAGEYSSLRKCWRILRARLSTACR